MNCILDVPRACRRFRPMATPRALLAMITPFFKTRIYLEAGRLILQDCQCEPAIIARLGVGDLRLRLLQLRAGASSVQSPDGVHGFTPISKFRVESESRY